jgi:protein TonB
MGDTLFEASLVPARPRAAGAGAFPLSLGAHAIGIAALLTVPLLGDGAPVPVGLPDHGPVVLTISAPPPEAPPPPRRVASSRPRYGRANPALATAPTRLVPLGDLSAAPTDDGPGQCLGCSLSTNASFGDGAGDVAAAGTGGGGGQGTGTAPLVVGGHVLPPLKLRHVDPVYPDLARRAGVRGVVRIECLVDREGRVAEARVVRGVPLLDAAALEAVRQWRYRPTLLNGVAVPVLMTVTVRFELR